jgi:hypothetical protein
MSLGLHRRLVCMGLPCGHCNGVVVGRRVARTRARIIVLLAVPLGEVSSVYALYARRAASPFAAMGWYHCDKAYDEFLSAASSRTRSTECGFAKPSLASKPLRPPARGLAPSFLGPATSALSWKRLRFARGHCARVYREMPFSARVLNIDLQLPRNTPKTRICAPCSRASLFSAFQPPLCPACTLPSSTCKQPCS